MYHTSTSHAATETLSSAMLRVVRTVPLVHFFQKYQHRQYQVKYWFGCQRIRLNRKDSSAKIVPTGRQYQ